MKIEFINDDIIVFLNKYRIKNIDLKSKDSLEKELRNIFEKLSNYYNIKISGYYNVTIYIDEYYGAILELKNEELDCIEYDIHEVDMRIILVNNKFLYKIDDIFNNIDGNIYKYKNNYYLEITSDINNILMGKILESSHIIYGNVTEDILKYGILLKKEDYVL